MKKTFGVLFILTGIFAIIGGLFTWGDGSLFDQHELVKVIIPFADIILTGPLSLISGYGIIKQKYWGQILGQCTSGIYMFGSVEVFISMFWNSDYSIFLLIPALSGLMIGLGFTLFTIKKNRL